MTMSKDLFLSILSMDAYNRGYNPGIAGLGGPGTGIGNATIDRQSETLPGTPGVAASFYGLAYQLNQSTGGIAAGTTIISYRGTDEPFTELFPLDLPMSYAGSHDQAQVRLAAEFYEQPPVARTPPRHQPDGRTDPAPTSAPPASTASAPPSRAPPSGTRPAAGPSR